MLSNQSKLETIEQCYTGLQLKLRNLFLEWTNEYLTYSRMAEHKGISEATMLAMLEEGRAIHNNIAAQCKQATD